jgi:hypothetical protein
MTSDFNIEKDHELGLFKGTFTINIPEISVTRYKADRSDFKYEIRRAVGEIVEEIVEKAIDE